ncbi:uncharacterized protein LOC119838772 [Zerene cesonia]|uniref:uncharacterized protein LOC119838772 n=1 Tax=Zerene cesonia TaxID=33412 RepID=UPI0018E4E1BF|nr:uncharacterized protein LOC119838772 [Zerene cesonia]
MDFTANSIKTRHSFYTNRTRSTVSGDTKTFSKSDVNVCKPRPINIHEREILSIKSSCGEYYKRYEHDEIPVKDDTSNDNSFKEDRTSAGAKDSITNSDLDKLEFKILNTMSQELQTEDMSIESLESNIKLFKITVQEIFDNFYANLQDYEFYKRKYNEILAKNQEDIVQEMEDFIKDMIQHIISSDNSATNSKTQTRDKSVSFDLPSERSPLSTVEAYRNQNYSTDSTFDESSNYKPGSNKKEETLNIYLLTGTPYVAIRMNNRNLLSDMNVRDSVLDEIEGQLASAENIKKIAAKKLQLEKYVTQQRVQTSRERDIPIKISSAKKDIPLNEDFINNNNSQEQSIKSFMSKICNYICKRFRKSSFN